MLNRQLFTIVGRLFCFGYVSGCKTEPGTAFFLSEGDVRTNMPVVSNTVL
jgi:hypothetical protein